MNGMLVYWLVQAWAALLMIGIGIPFILKKIPPNSVAGFRTQQTMCDPEVWYEANKTMGWDLLIAGLAMLAALIATFLRRATLPFNDIVILNLLVTVLAVTGMVIHGFWKLAHLVKK